MNKSILERESLSSIPLEVEPKLICKLIAGSHLYGLNGPNSDIDYRVVYQTTNPVYVFGLREPKTYVSTSDEIDSASYELRHFMRLMAKTNTQCAEMMFASDEAFLYCGEIFKEMRANAEKLFDSDRLFASLKGYLHNERRLALGERKGRLGGKRKAALDEFGFSHKNVVQFIRLCEVGKGLFENGVYQVSFKEHKSYSLLMEIKTNPGSFKLEQLISLLDQAENSLFKSFENKKVKFEFDYKLAGDILKRAYS